KVDAAELHHYVSTKVSNWALANRGARQTPVLRPRGTLGIERARRIHLTVVPPGPPPTADPAPVFEPPEALAQEWAKYHRLREEVPAPAVHSPLLWRRYRDTLLRYEELLQAGDADGARTLAGRLFGLEQALRQARVLSLGSAGSSLAAAALTGAEAPPSDAADRALAELWAVP